MAMATITWTGAAGDGNYNNPANWSPAQVPGAADSVTISPAAATSITAGNDTVGSLTTSKTVSLHVSNNTTFGIGNGSASATVSNAGSLFLDSGGNGTGLLIDDTRVTLTGGGHVVLSDNGNNYIEGASAADTLTNVNNIISGAGALGNGQLTLVNSAGGTINATGTNALVLNTGTTTTVNGGLFEATGSGGLVIQTTINNGAGGHITAAGGVVSLNGGTIQGGTLSSSGGGQVDTNNATLDGTANTVTNTGIVQVDNNTALTLLGTLSNTGTLVLDSLGNGTGLIVGPSATPGTVTLTGGGHVVLSDNGNNYVEAAIAGDTLVNLNNTISGAGSIGNGSLSVVNDGTINANGTNALVLNAQTPTLNNALVEATGTGGLYVETTLNQSGGGTLLAAGGNVYLQGTDVGGKLGSTGTAAIVVQNGSLVGTASAVSNTGSVSVSNNNVLYVSGSLVNTGTITLGSGGNSTGFIVNSGTVTLSGGGLVTTTDEGGDNYFEGAAAGNTLVNAGSTIAGSGNFGDGQLIFVNNGTLNANQTHALTLNTASTITNNKLIEATGSGGIVLNGNTAISNGTTGMIVNAGSSFSLNGGDIIGGTLTSTHGGVFYSNNGTLDGSAHGITSSAAIQVDNNNALYALGTLANSGTITLASGGNSTGFIIDSPTLTLTGGGVVTTSDEGYDNYFQGAAVGDTLVNLDNTIEGSGNFGNGQLTFINDATVNANQTHALVLNLGATFTNNALVEETGTGGITVDGNTLVSNAGGTVAATGAGGITLNGATIAGGTLTSGQGSFYSNNGTLDGSAHTVTSSAAIQVDNNNALYLLGTLANSGTITLASGGNSTAFIIDSPTLTLTGGGVVTTSDEGYDNYFQGAAVGDTLVNLDNTIEGSGNFGNGQLTFINDATVNANQTHALVLNLGATFTNNALVEETGTGGITVDGNTIIDNGSQGTISLSGTGGLSLNGGTIAGGTLKGSGGTIYSNNGTIDGSAHTVTSSAAIQVDNNNDLYALGTIANSGTITLDSGGNSTAFIVDSQTLTLTGGGVVTTTDEGYDNYFQGAAAGDTLDNLNNTIEGSGNFGNGQLDLVNAGTIDANQNNVFYLNLGGSSTGSNTASGQMLATGAGGLDFRSGLFTNAGLIQADSGSHVVFEGGATLTNDSAAGTLTGGTYGAVSAGGTATATASFSGAAVSTLAADLLLSGAGSEISFGGTTIEASLKTIAKTGELQILGTRDYTTKNKLTSSGTVALGGGTLKAAGLNDKAGSVLTGFGTLNAKFTDAGSVVATGGELDLIGKTNTVSGTISGTGTLGFGGTTTLNTGTVLDVGHLALLNKATLAIAAPVSFAGTFAVVGTASLTGTGTFTNTGLFEATGKGIGTISDPFANAGTISVATGGSLAFSGGLANTGLVLDNGTFTDTAALTGGSLTLGGAAAQATLASMAGAGPSTLATLTTAGGALNTSGTTLTVTGDYNNTAAGVGNAYTPFAGITGTINGQGTQLAVVGVQGTTISNVNGTLTIAIAAGHTAHFEVENTGAAGAAALRGALQTTVNGGSISGTALSGSGVTAADFGPIQAGGASGSFSIHYSGGTLTNEAIHLASDFANVAGLTIDIVAQPAMQPMGGTTMPDMHDALAWHPLLTH